MYVNFKTIYPIIFQSKFSIYITNCHTCQLQFVAFFIVLQQKSNSSVANVTLFATLPKKNDDINVVIAFFVVLQQKNKKKVMATLLLSPSSLCYNKKR